MAHRIEIPHACSKAALFPTRRKTRLDAFCVKLRHSPPAPIQNPSVSATGVFCSCATLSQRDITHLPTENKKAVSTIADTDGWMSNTHQARESLS